MNLKKQILNEIEEGNLHTAFEMINTLINNNDVRLINPDLYKVLEQDFVQNYKTVITGEFIIRFSVFALGFIEMKKYFHKNDKKEEADKIMQYLEALSKNSIGNPKIIEELQVAYAYWEEQKKDIEYNSEPKKETKLESEEYSQKIPKKKKYIYYFIPILVVSFFALLFYEYYFKPPSSKKYKSKNDLLSISKKLEINSTLSNQVTDMVEILKNKMLEAQDEEDKKAIQDVIFLLSNLLKKYTEKPSPDIEQEIKRELSFNKKKFKVADNNAIKSDDLLEKYQLVVNKINNSDETQETKIEIINLLHNYLERYSKKPNQALKDSLIRELDYNNKKYN